MLAPLRLLPTLCQLTMYSGAERNNKNMYLDFMFLVRSSSSSQNPLAFYQHSMSTFASAGRRVKQGREMDGRGQQEWRQ